jgi:hypothetical protein
MTLPASHETLYPTRQGRRGGSSSDATFPLLAARFSLLKGGKQGQRDAGIQHPVTNLSRIHFQRFQQYSVPPHKQIESRSLF